MHLELVKGIWQLHGDSFQWKHMESQIIQRLGTMSPGGLNEKCSNFLWVGPASLSLVLGNMVVARQILLIFNLSYLPCSVQFVNKNYCHAKKQSLYDLLMPLFCAWMMYCEFGRSFNEHTKRSETERGSDVESQMSKVGKCLRSENRWELLQEKRTDMKL